MRKKYKQLAPITIGTWALSDKYWGEQTHSNSLKTVHAALRSGFNSFDTAQAYGNGRSEQLLGQQLPRGQKIIISTKTFIKPLKTIERNLDISLKRLNREYIDYFFIHWPSTKEDCRPVIELLEKFRTQGKINNIGVSNFNHYYLELAKQAGNIDIVQNAFNFLWTSEADFIKECKAQGIQTQIYSPLAQGLLTGKFTNDFPYKANDQRYKMTLFNKDNLSIIYNYIPKLKKVADENSTTIHNLILKWLESIPFIDSIVVGCRKREQIEDLLTLKNLNLSSKTLNDLSLLSNKVSNEIVGGDNIFNHSY